jgi:hypothetical protein
MDCSGLGDGGPGDQSDSAIGSECPRLCGEDEGCSYPNLPSILELDTSYSKLKADYDTLDSGEKLSRTGSNMRDAMNVTLSMMQIALGSRLRKHTVLAVQRDIDRARVLLGTYDREAKKDLQSMRGLERARRGAVSRIGTVDSVETTVASD